MSWTCARSGLALTVPLICRAGGSLGKVGGEIEALEGLVQRGFYVSVALFCGVLKRCVQQKDEAVGRRIHALSLETGLQSCTFLGNNIIRMYASLGRLHEAFQVFTGLAAPNAFSWSIIILAQAKLGEPAQIIKLYHQMRQVTVNPTSYVLVAVLKACTSEADLASGKQVHADILESEVEPNLFVCNCLVDMYAKCGSLKDARRVFDGVAKRDVVSWNAMIAGYAQNGLGQEALTLYAEMVEEGIVSANHVTFGCLIKACASLGDVHRGKQLHLEIHSRGMESDVGVGSSLVDMYVKCGSLEDARKAFDSLPAKDVVTWTAMIAGYAQFGRGHEALSLYGRMQQEGVTPANHVTFVCLLNACASIKAIDAGKELHSKVQERGLEADVVVGNSLVDMYAKCGSLEDARRVFEHLPTKDSVTWNAMVAGYTDQGHGQEALTVYGRMKQLGVPLIEPVTFVCLLKACSSVGAVREGKELHDQIRERGLETDLVVANCLVDMYVKCGSLEDARRVFDILPTRNVITWTSMIAGYAQQGLGQEALNVYARMQEENITPANLVTFACLLKACSSTGDLRQGKELHLQIQERGLEADLVVGNCLVDMYAKCGSMEDASRVFERLPRKDAVTWTAMIAGYAEEGLGQDALALYARMQEEGIRPADRAMCVCLLKSCASVGALHHGKELHLHIRSAGLESDEVVGISLLDMYAKCGSLGDARIVFDRLPTRNVVAWTAFINGFAQHNQGRMGLLCFEEMLQYGVEPNEATFLCVLAACSREGLVHEGRHYFKLMVESHGINPSVCHHNCMVDLLGRAGHLQEAETMLQTMPFKTNYEGWMSLLNACKSHGDVERGRRSFDLLTRLDPQNAAPYVFMASMYTNVHMWSDVRRIESLRRLAGACKKPARAWIEVNSKVHTFDVGQERDDVSSKLKSVNFQLEEEAGHYSSPELLQALSDRAKGDALCGHAEKLALAYGLLNTPDGMALLVTKNLRMCNDCHNGTKAMSRIEKREIIVRDTHRVHRFVDGTCSCGDRH